jgi:hypothetical protein
VTAQGDAWAEREFELALADVGLLVRGSEAVAARFGTNSVQHNLLRELVAFELGARAGEYEDAVAYAAGPAHVEELYAEHAVPAPAEWRRFFPGRESRAWARFVDRSAGDDAALEELRTAWGEAKAAAETAAPELADGRMRPPEWLEDGSE